MEFAGEWYLCRDATVRPMIRLRMRAVDTTDIVPMSHAQDVTLPLREDAVTEADRHDLYQSVAPAVQSGLYLVPKVIE